MISLITNNPQNAENLFNTAIVQAEDLENKFLFAESNLHKAKALAVQNKYDEATIAINIAQDLSISKNYSSILSDIYKTSSTIAQGQNNYQKSF